MRRLRAKDSPERQLEQARANAHSRKYATDLILQGTSEIRYFEELAAELGIEGTAKKRSF